jgi:phosphoribosylglycinamide formyltransferase 2
MHKKVLLLGSGELGKELVIALKRLGQTVIAVDNYLGAPAMQVADGFEVINMLDAIALSEVVEKHKPDIIVPEVEAIRTELFYTFEAKGIQITPSARAANFTMNRKLIRDLASKELGVKTACYVYADSLQLFLEGIQIIGLPCVVKPLMSSSGKGQNVLRNIEDATHVFEYAMQNSRGDIKEVILEEFIEFDAEITLLTITQKNGETIFCEPIGHVQERGDYQESWQPHIMQDEFLLEAKEISRKITHALGGYGIWGIEFFLSTKNGVYFSELSPRPHDTGMVTLAGTQSLNEFELHVRAFLGLPIPEIELLRYGASAVVLANDTNTSYPVFSGIELVLNEPKTDVKIFGKPATRPNRRMGVVLTNDIIGTDIKELRDKAKKAAALIHVN